MNEGISARDEKAATSDGICSQHLAQRHQLIVPTRTLPCWLALVSMSGCVCSYMRTDDPRDRSHVIKVATQFILEYLSTVPATMPLDKDIIHDAPPGLSELVDNIWNQACDRVPARGRWGRILLAVREVILLFMSAGINVAFLGYEVHRDPRSSQVMRDAYVLDCRIGSAAESFDLLHEWAK
eukprot:2954990-Pyramimonas_sp.AAC.1